jgi:hypothetical protein
MLATSGAQSATGAQLGTAESPALGTGCAHWGPGGALRTAQSCPHWRATRSLFTPPPQGQWFFCQHPVLLWMNRTYIRIKGVLWALLSVPV